MKYSFIYFSLIIIFHGCNSEIDNFPLNKVAITQKQRDSIVGTPIKIGNIEVAENEFPICLSWDQAKRECKNLGNDWRLPTKDEIAILMKSKDSINFVTGFYWSDTEWDSHAAISFAFYNGVVDGYTGKHGANHVYAVRSKD